MRIDVVIDSGLNLGAGASISDGSWFSFQGCSLLGCLVGELIARYTLVSWNPLYSYLIRQLQNLPSEVPDSMVITL